MSTLNIRSAFDLALEMAEKAAGESNFPVGAVLLGRDGEFITKASNDLISNSPTGRHAEHHILDNLLPVLNLPNREDMTLVLTHEPGPGTAAMLLEADIGRVLYALSDDEAGMAGKPDFFPEAQRDKVRQVFSPLTVGEGPEQISHEQLERATLLKAALETARKNRAAAHKKDSQDVATAATKKPGFSSLEDRAAKAQGLLKAAGIASEAEPFSARYNPDRRSTDSVLNQQLFNTAIRADTELGNRRNAAALLDKQGNILLLVPDGGEHRTPIVRLVEAAHALKAQAKAQHLEGIFPDPKECIIVSYAEPTILDIAEASRPGLRDVRFLVRDWVHGVSSASHEITWPPFYITQKKVLEIVHGPFDATRDRTNIHSSLGSDDPSIILQGTISPVEPLATVREGQTDRRDPVRRGLGNLVASLLRESPTRWRNAPEPMENGWNFSVREKQNGGVLLVTHIHHLQGTDARIAARFFEQFARQVDPNIVVKKGIPPTYPLNRIVTMTGSENQMDALTTELLKCSEILQDVPILNEKLRELIALADDIEHGISDTRCSLRFTVEPPAIDTVPSAQRVLLIRTLSDYFVNALQSTELQGIKGLPPLKGIEITAVSKDESWRDARCRAHVGGHVITVSGKEGIEDMQAIMNHLTMFEKVPGTSPAAIEVVHNRPRQPINKS